ncbi:MAG: DUF504 domain-containing protein [Candidatus Woesearchaeota archaeon]
MTTIKELINKIKYDKREKPEDYVLYYFDRIQNKLIPLKYIDILRVEEDSMIVMKDGKETAIPLHRVREVRKKEEIVWKRS